MKGDGAMKREFVMQRGATRVIFGDGARARVQGAVGELGAVRVMVVATPRRAAEAAALAAQLGSSAVGVLAIAKEHVPRSAVQEARREAERVRADAVLAFGGGSAIGLAKAVAAELPVKVIAVPTTYSGSEMTPVFGITDGGEKVTRRDERVRPALVIYDATLLSALPRSVTVASLWNAMAHAVEALWVLGRDRATELSAEEALRLLAGGVAALAANLDDDGARRAALEGAYLAGAVFGDVGGGLHHKLCHVLGGGFALPHAATHAALLPHVVGFHCEAAPDAMRAIATALGVVDPVLGLKRLAQATGAPRSLASLGMPKDGIARVVQAILASPPSSPRSLDAPSLEALLEAAWAEPPRGESRPLRAPEKLDGPSGLGAPHQSEALAGALPRTQNAPRRGPFGLYPELLNGTPFTVRSAENSRVWMYRIRPSFSHGELLPLPSPRFGAPLLDASPNRERWRPLPIPVPPQEVDFVDGLVTLGGAGDPTSGPGYRVHLYATNADMSDCAFSNADGDLLVVPQEGTLECRTELGWLRVAPGSVLIVPRALKFAIGLPDGVGRGWVLEVFGRRLRLPERGPIGSNGLADARHFIAPAASYEDRTPPAGFRLITQLGGRLFTATQAHSPFDVVAWHGNHAPHAYDLSLFNAMGSVTFDHPDPSILTVLTAPLDDHGRAIADVVVFPGRWEVIEHSFRPPFMHRNAASEINMVVRAPSPSAGYDPGCTFLSPLLTAHGVSTATYDHVLAMPDDAVEPPRRIPDESLWLMFESAMPFRTTAWAREAPERDATFRALSEGMRSRFDPTRR